MKGRWRLAVYIPMGLVAAACIYIWICIIISHVSGNMLNIAGIDIAVCPVKLSEGVDKNTVVGISKGKTTVKPGDIFLANLSEDGTYQLGKAVSVSEDGIWAKTKFDVLPELIHPSRVVGVALFESSVLGGVMAFLSTPMGVAAGAIVPVALLLVIQLLYILGKKRNK